MIFTSYNMVLFGKKIKQIRKELKFTQSFVYQKTGIHTDTIRRLEKGLNIPNYETLERLSSLYVCDLINLLNICKTDTPLYEIYKCIDKIILNNSTYISSELEMIIDQFIVESKNSQLIDNRIIEQSTNLIVLIPHFINRHKHNTAELIDGLKKCFQLTCGINNFRNNIINVLSFLELRILLMIAILKIDQNNYNESNEILMLIKKILEAKVLLSTEEKKIYIKCLCNLAYNYHDLNNNEMSLEIASLGINFCRENEIIYLLYLLYARQAIAKLKLGLKNYNVDVLNCICLLDILEYRDLKNQYIKIFSDEYNINIYEYF